MNSKAYFNLGGIIRTIILIPIFGTLPGITVSAIGYLMKDKVIKWFAFIIIILSSLETWCCIYLHTSQLIMLSVSTILLPFLFCLRTNLKIWKASFVTTIVGILGTLAILIIDIHNDPTSHNLFPFEIVINTLFIFTISFASAALGTAIKLLIKRNKEKHAPLNANKI